MARPARRLHSPQDGRMWDTDPRMRKILSRDIGTSIDWSVFTREELAQLLIEMAGSDPDLKVPPKAEMLL